MDKLYKSDINFSLLEKLPNQGTTSVVYKDKENKKCYKIFRDLSYFEKSKIYYKFIEIFEDDVKEEGLLLPEIAIIDESGLSGYVCDYVEDSIDLGTKYETDKEIIDTKDLSSSIKNASQLLERTHSHNLIIQDLNFGNILEDKNNKAYFCDFDQCKYNGYQGEYVSAPLGRFTGFKYINITKSTDNLSLLLGYLGLLFQKDVRNISKREYDKLKERLKTLKNIEPYFNILLNDGITYHHYPYLHDFIDDKDEKILIKINNKKNRGII